jgi:hypothetical protein
MSGMTMGFLLDQILPAAVRIAGFNPGADKAIKRGDALRALSVTT